MNDLKELLVFLFAFGTAADQAKQNDGKIDISDAGLLMGAAMQLPAAFSGISNIPSYARGMTAADRLELQKWSSENFDISNDRLEEQIEAAIVIAIQLQAFIPKAKTEIKEA